MYKAFGLFQTGCTFDLDEAAARLRGKFPGYSVARNGDQVTVSKGDWEIEFATVSGPHVRAETEGLVGRLAGIGPAEAEAMTACDRRVEVWSDTPDPFVEHFNDYLSAVEVLKSFPGILAVDPKEPGVL